MPTLAAPPTSRHTNRTARYEAGQWLRDRSSRAGAKWCMYALDRSVTVAGSADGSVHTSGVRRCASPWACPYCSPVIAEVRAGLLDQAFSEWVRRGGTILFVTATLRHNYGDDLADLLAMVQDSWSATFRFKRRPSWYGGQSRAIEVTHGGKGWHPHIHAAIFVKPGEHDRAVRALAALGYDWATNVGNRGGFSLVRKATSPGWDVRTTFDTSGLSDYLLKVSGGWGLGLELAAAYRKSGHKAGRTHFELLRDAMAGDRQALVLFNVYERATAGRQAIVSTPGLLASLAVEDLADDDAVAVAPSDVVTVLMVVPARVWRGLLRTGGAAQLLADVSARASGHWPPERDWDWPPGWTMRYSPSSALAA